VFFSAQVTDLETGGSGAGASDTTCRFAGESIKWGSPVAANGARPGDRVRVDATAAGAIDDSDTKTVTLHWQT
jgi:hypothetical protein